MMNIAFIVSIQMSKKYELLSSRDIVQQMDYSAQCMMFFS